MARLKKAKPISPVTPVSPKVEIVSEPLTLCNLYNQANFEEFIIIGSIFDVHDSGLPYSFRILPVVPRPRATPSKPYWT
jgi:hypothetical protein